MRKILSEEERVVKERRNKIILSVFIIGMMVLSSAGYAFFSSGLLSRQESAEKMSYGALELTKSAYGGWEFATGGRSFKTAYNPLETENISVIISKNLDNYQNQVLYFGVDLKEDISESGSQEIFANLGWLVLRSNLACLTDNCTEDYPIKNCTEANVIVFKKDSAQIARVRDSENCVFIYYSGGDAQLAADAFLFKILGVQ